MRWYGKEITVARGETFSLTCEITNEEGVPYMISSALTNPTFLLTVSNTLYKSDSKRYVLKCWTPLVVNLDDPENPVYVNGFVFDTFEIGETDLTSAPADVSIRKLYKSTTDNKYYIYDAGEWKEYKTVFVQNFPSEITREWYSKNFYYELRLVAGEYTDEFIAAIDDNTYSQFDDNPFDLITEEFVIIPKTQMNVLSRLGGYDNA